MKEVNLIFMLIANMLDCENQEEVEKHEKEIKSRIAILIDNGRITVEQSEFLIDMLRIMVYSMEKEINRKEENNYDSEKND